MVLASGVKVSCEGVGLKYGTFAALRDIDLLVEAGSFVTLLGPSGSGKTSLLMAIAGFARPTSGRIAFDERPVDRDPPQARRIGLVFQDYALFPHMSVFENAAYSLRVAGVSRARQRAEGLEALELVRMTGFADRPIATLSGGQRQRVAIARALARKPPLLLLDEPFSALDRNLRDSMQLELRDLHARLGTTIISVTHDQREAFTLSDRIAVLNEGRLQQAGAPDELYHRPVNRFVASFLGEGVYLSVETSGDSLLCQGRLLRPGMAPKQARKYVLLVRPTELVPLPRSASAPAGANLLEGTVTDVIFQGESALVVLASDAGTFMWRAEQSTLVEDGPERGETRRFALPSLRSIVFPAEEAR